MRRLGISHLGPLTFLAALALAVVPAWSQGSGDSVDPARVLGPPQGRALAGAELDETTEAVASELRCPVCQGMSVAASHAETAIAMRNQARELLSEGYTPAQVLAYFEGTFGEFVLLDPKAQGFNWIVWVAPAAGLLLGLIVLVLYLRPRTGSTEMSDLADTDPELSAYQQRVREELAASNDPSTTA